MRKIESFFKKVEEAAWSCGEINFPNTSLLTEYISKGKLTKYEISKAVSTGMRKIKPYFCWYDNNAFSSSKLALYEKAYNEDYNTAYRKIVETEKKYRSDLERYSNIEIDKVDDYAIQFPRICRLDDGLAENKAKLQKTQNTLPENSKELFIKGAAEYVNKICKYPQLDYVYIDYWIDLKASLEDFYTCEDYDIELIPLYIPVSKEWTRDRLAILYRKMVEFGWIEEHKESTFVDVFSGFYTLNSELLLPIRWTFPVSANNIDRVSSNIAALHYLVAALKDRDLFELIVQGLYQNIEGKYVPFIPIKEDTLHEKDKERICKYFVYADGSSIDKNSLSYKSKGRINLKIVDYAHTMDKKYVRSKLGFPIDTNLIQDFQSNLLYPNQIVKKLNSKRRNFKEIAYKKVIEMLDSIP